MRCKETILWLVASLFFAVTATAQVKKSAKSSGFKVPRVAGYSKRARKICPFSKQSGYPYQGIGFKLGDPFAITYKFYPNKRWALVGDVGVAAAGLSSRYYKSLFSRYVPEELAENISYLEHKVLFDWCLQAKLLHRWEIYSIFKGLYIYTGLGWQWRITKIKYDYTYADDNAVNQLSKVLVFETPRFTLGGLVVVGFEYAYFSLPLSAFLETELFLDALSDPGYRNFQGSIGIRYIF